MLCCYVMLRCYVMLCYVTLCYVVTLCYAMLCYVMVMVMFMLCYVMLWLCYVVMLWYVMLRLCYVMLYIHIYPSIFKLFRLLFSHSCSPRPSVALHTLLAALVCHVDILHKGSVRVPAVRWQSSISDVRNVAGVCTPAAICTFVITSKT